MKIIHVNYDVFANGMSRQTVTNGDNGGRGSQNWDFCGDILFEWPLRAFYGAL